MKRCAVIGDIIRSRTLSDRGEVQKQLEQVLEEVNERFREEIASRFIITLGDEFQGLLLRPTRVFDLLQWITLRMHPVRLRYGVGVGEISTDIDPYRALGADGPAYHRARGMLEQVKSREKVQQSDCPDLLYDSGCPEDGIINALANLCWSLEKGWKPGQRRIVAHALEGEKTHRDIAEALMLSRSTVSRTLHKSLYYKYRSGLNQLRDYLLHQWEGEQDAG